MAGLQAVSFWVGLIGVLSGGALVYDIWERGVHLLPSPPYFYFAFVGLYTLGSLYMVISAIIFRIRIGK